MAITRWAPFSAFTSLEREMHDVMSRLSGRPLFEGFDWRPATDAYEEEGRLVVRTEIPGIAAEDIDVKVEEGVLLIMGEKRADREVKEEDRYMRECRYGSFRRELMLPEGVDPDGIIARYENGILTVQVPLPVEKTEPKPVKIEVRAPGLVATDS